MSPLGADPRPGTRPLRDTALGAFDIQLEHASSDGVTARMPSPAPRDGAALHVLAETVASTAAGLAAGEGRRAFGAELDAATLTRPDGTGWVTATATPLALESERHVWQIDVTSEAELLVLRGRCTLGIVDAPND